MKRYLHILFLLSVALSKSYGQSGLCDTMYWHHTYFNQRLKIYDSCYTITGTVQIELPPLLTGDGDYHIYVQPDSAFQWMQYYRDSAYTKLCLGSDSAGYHICSTCLNVEEICKGTITDGGNTGDTEKAACMSFNDTVYLPNVGEYVRITGPFVYDTVHCWNELHPVSNMSIITTTGINSLSPSFVNSLKVFPQPANNIVKFQFAQPPHVITLIKLYTITGKQLYIYALAETNLLNVDVSSWPSGEYLYTIDLQGERTPLKSGKISVMH